MGVVKDGRDYEDRKIVGGLERRVMGEVFKRWFSVWKYKINRLREEWELNRWGFYLGEGGIYDFLVKKFFFFERWVGGFVRMVNIFMEGDNVCYLVNSR